MENNVVVLDIILAHRFLSEAGWVGDEYRYNRPYSGIVLVLNGSADYLFSGKVRFHVKKDDLIYLPAGEGYVVKTTSTSPFEHVTVNFILSQPQALAQLPGVQHLKNPVKVEQIFTKLIAIWTARGEHYPIRCFSLLYELIYAALRESGRVHDIYRTKLEPSIRHIEAHFTDPGPISGLADQCGLSPTYFRRLFRKVYKQSAASYITRLRMSYASDLLLSGLYTIGQTAELCGFVDEAYFSRVFKQTYGIPPSKYHKLYKLTDDSRVKTKPLP